MEATEHTQPIKSNRPQAVEHLLRTAKLPSVPVLPRYLDTRAEDQRKLARILLETGEEAPPASSAGVTAAGAGSRGCVLDALELAQRGGSALYASTHTRRREDP
jgi:hypothetical protein